MIKKYRKKPVVIEAIQLTADTFDEVVKFTDGSASVLRDCTGPDAEYGSLACIIPTLEGNMVASEGDYIIKGVKGEFYPCKPDIFEQTYEAVDTAF